MKNTAGDTCAEALNRSINSLRQPIRSGFGCGGAVFHRLKLPIVFDSSDPSGFNASK